MKTRKLFVILLLATCPFMSFAQKMTQETSSKTINLSMNKDTLFNEVIDYLQDNSFFLMSIDKQAGFIQAKIYIKNPNILSVKVGERRTLNFIIRPIQENQSKLSLNIYCEEKYFGGDSGNGPHYYYKEIGISEDIAIYKSILDGLSTAIKSSMPTPQE